MLQQFSHRTEAQTNVIEQKMAERALLFQL